MPDFMIIIKILLSNIHFVYRIISFKPLHIIIKYFILITSYIFIHIIFKYLSKI